MPTPATVDDYIAGFPPDRRAGLEQLRSAARAAAPEATETIAYGMPALRSHGGQFLVSYAAYKRHYSLFPSTPAVEDELGDEIKPHLAGKGTIQFAADQPIPVDLVERIVRIRVRENEARARR